MSISMFADISASAPNLFREEGKQLWVRSAKSVALFGKRQAIAGSANWDVQNGAASAYNVAEGADVASGEFSQDDVVKMTLSRGIYRASFGFSHTEMAVASLYSASTAADLVYDRVRKQFLGSIAKLARLVEVDTAVGTGTSTNNPSSTSVTNIFGWQPILGASGSYAGQSFNYATPTNPGLASYVKGSIGNVGRKDFDLAFAQIDGYSGLMPDFIMCGPQTGQYVKQIGDNQVRFNVNGESVALRELGVGSPIATEAESMMSYNGVPVIINNAWGASGANLEGTILIGRRDEMGYDVLPYGDFGDAVKEETIMLAEGTAGMNQLLGIPCKAYTLGKTGSSMKWTIELELALCIYRPNCFAVLSGVTGASKDSA